MKYACNICGTLLDKTGKPLTCPTCGAKYWPHETPR